MRRLLATLIALLVPVGASAHMGHGGHHGYPVSHYLSDFVHAPLAVLFVVGAATVVFFALRGRRSRR